ncbi:aminotransferase class III-fold pyridoxal phosphate-dependent enzyme, partial [Acinetobacter baumannii]|uniref:aminotransferase class III-fold pyridoxal phosphate-dependent enzyme n=1 Tax=Acinetobacter baumannii TaxID=470 RepID=UPI00111249C4
LNAINGIAVCGIGHTNPTIAEAITEQKVTLVHMRNLFEIHWQNPATRDVPEVSGQEKIFFSYNSAESNAGAIILA